MFSGKKNGTIYLQRFHAEGTYFSYGGGRGHVRLANYTTQQTYIYRELPLGENQLTGSHNYLHNEIGWSLHLNKTILEECIRENSNAPYWENDKGGFSRDIRNPLYAQDLAAVLEQMEKTGRLCGGAGDSTYIA